MRDDKSAVRLERRRDVARKLGVSESQVLKFERAGLLRRVKIPGLRAVRYDADESAALARRWIEDSKHGARGAGGAKQKMGDEPHAKRWGWLKNGNRPGDVSKAPRCGARTTAHAVSRAGHAERAVSDARRNEHRPAHASRARTQSTGAVETWSSVPRNTGSAPGEPRTLAESHGATRGKPELCSATTRVRIPNGKGTLPVIPFTREFRAA
jgi:hypothetical protein